ncbi:MAG: DUF1801 domain-containing protein [Chloroflexota bacterium]|nr:DUF1801 domain-containing protein [Chloroflexota bacterium]
MSENVNDVDVYLQNLRPERRTALESLRSLIFKVVPDAVETIRYGMPAYEYEGRQLCLFASQKRYMSLYLDTEIVERHRDKLKGLSVGKSCIRFKKFEALPRDVVELMLTEAAQSTNDG